MAGDSIRYPELTPELRGGFSWRLLRYFGAGAIIASVTIGSGETLFASRGGAVFGYALLWCFVGGTLMKAVQVYTAARYMTLTGEHPMTHWASLPGPRGWVPLLIGVLSLLCFPFWLAGLPLALGQAINWIFGIVQPEHAAQFLLCSRIWATLIIFVAVIITLVQTYAVLERVQTIIVGILLVCVICACLASRPDWLRVLLGSVVPTLPDYEEWIIRDYPSIASKSKWVEAITYMGAVGGGTYDYLGYISCLREKKWGALGLRSDGQSSSSAPPAGKLPIDTGRGNLRRGKGWLLAPRTDTGISFLAVLIFAGCFLILGAEILRPQELVPEGNELLTHQAQFLTQFHPLLLYVYQLGIFMAFWGTIYGAYEIYSRSAYECLRALSPRLREVPSRHVRTAVVLYCAAGGLILLWTFQDPIGLVRPAAIVGGVLTCGLWCFAMIWSDHRFLPKPFRMSRLLLTLTVISGAVLTIVGGVALWEYLAGLVR